MGRIRQCVTSFGSHRRNTDQSLKFSVSSYRHCRDLVRCRNGSGETTVVEEEQNPVVGLSVPVFNAVLCCNRKRQSQNEHKQKAGE